MRRRADTRQCRRNLTRDVATLAHTSDDDPPGHGKQNFQLRGKKPIEMWVSTELGNAMQRRSMRFAVEDQL